MSGFSDFSSSAYYITLRGETGLNSPVLIGWKRMGPSRMEAYHQNRNSAASFVHKRPLTRTSYRLSGSLNNERAEASMFAVVQKSRAIVAPVTPVGLPRSHLLVAPRDPGLRVACWGIKYFRVEPEYPAARDCLISQWFLCSRLGYFKRLVVSSGGRARSNSQ